MKYSLIINQKLINCLFVCVINGVFSGKETICQIPLKDILSVERVSYESFKRSNMLQVIQPSRILYVQVSDNFTIRRYSQIKNPTLYNSQIVSTVWL